MRRNIERAMRDCDTYVVELEYLDSRGHHTRRVVSPIRFLSSNRFLALCLCSEAPRQFRLNRCQNIRLRGAHDYVMPVPMEELPAPSPAEHELAAV